MTIGDGRSNHNVFLACVAVQQGVAGGQQGLTVLRIGIRGCSHDGGQPQRAKQRHRDLAEQIGRSLKLSDYPDTFPARRRARKLIAVLGPTNSGKTHDAFERLAVASSGVYLGPLRLLALEAFTRLNEEFGVRASLLTGEERRIVEGSRVTASTIEMLDPVREVEPFGTFVTKPGAMLAASDGFFVTLRGRGGHGSTPWLGVDPVVAMAEAIADVRMSWL